MSNAGANVKGGSPLAISYHNVHAGISTFLKITLNPELVGVCGVMAAVISYEEDVGSSYSTCLDPNASNR